MCTVKSTLLSTLLASSISASVLLAPEDVPAECATICGPVVELTDRCSLGTYDTSPSPEDEIFVRVKRRKVRASHRRQIQHDNHDRSRFHEKKPMKRAVVTNAFGQVVTVPAGLGDGKTFTVTAVVTFTATPEPSPATGQLVTTQPAAGVPALDTSSVMTTVMEMVVPEEGGDLTLPANPAVPTTTLVAVGNAADGGTDEKGDDTDAPEHAETEESDEAITNAEKRCVCENGSFDVAAVSGLCSSCISQAGYLQECKCQLLISPLCPYVSLLPPVYFHPLMGGIY